MILNLEKTCRKRNALIIYIEKPFVSGVSNTHTNEVEVLEMVRVLGELGYNIDIMDYQMNKLMLGKVPFSKYDLVIGIEFFWLSMAKKFCKDTCTVIFYATGAWPHFTKAAQLKRYKNFTYRTGVKIDADVKFSKETLLIGNKVLAEVDGIISTGNEWTLSTYRHINDYVYSSPVTGFRFKTYDVHEEQEVNKHSFLWFGSRGLVHKGLDLCIEVFSKRTEETLYIAGPREEKVFSAYAKELKRKNIRYVGFLNVRTRQYENICKKCAFVIFPSCSEAGASSVITVMAMGLIPIVTKEASVNVGEFGFELRDDKIETINECVEYVITLSDEEIRRRQRMAYEYVMHNHSLENYSSRLQKAVREITKKRKGELL